MSNDPPVLLPLVLNARGELYGAKYADGAPVVVGDRIRYRQAPGGVLPPAGDWTEGVAVPKPQTRYWPAGVELERADGVRFHLAGHIIERLPGADIETKTTADKAMTRGAAHMTMRGMNKTSQADAGAKIAAAEPFDAGTIRGSFGPEGEYTVWSYHEPIGGRTASGQWWRSTSKHSQTTSRHQEIVARALEGFEAVDVRA